MDKKLSPYQKEIQRELKIYKKIKQEIKVKSYRLGFGDATMWCCREAKKKGFEL